MALFIRYGERVFLTLLSMAVIYRLLPQIPEHPQLVLFLASEIASVIFILYQSRGAQASALYPVLVAYIGTSVNLLVMPIGFAVVSNTGSTILVFAGATIALGAKLSLRRSFGMVAANRGVKRGGLYRVVRHPMYAGYIVNQLGFLLLFFSPWNIAVYAIAWIAQLARVVEEEEFLLQDGEYRAYAAEVRSRLVPGIV